MVITPNTPVPSHDRIPKVLFREYPLLEKTLILTRISHRGQFYNGKPYFHHPIRVALRMNWYDVSPNELYAALFHDTKEDTDLTDSDLLHFGYDHAVLFYRNSLTREKDGDQTYKEYIQGLIQLGNLPILRIKLCDLYENSNNVRFLPPEKRKVMVRYGKSIKDIAEYLTKSEDGLKLLENTISGELDKETLEAWIGETPTFL